MHLYQENTTPDFSFQLFAHPSAAYRGAPFWAWNTNLNQDQLLRQIEIFKQMGMGGFHMHARVGLATEYLGPTYMELVRACVEKARQEGMLAWLYDEDRWPSGAAGGLVTADPRFRARHLLFTRIPYEHAHGPLVEKQGINATAGRAGNGILLARYEVKLQDGWLIDYRRLLADEEAPAGVVIWYAYLETARESPWFNGQTYVDTLQREAIQRFLAVTHERYARMVGEYFGSIIPAIFTDEPQFNHKETFHLAEEQRDLILPWTADFVETFARIYGHRLEESLPELFWELPGRQASLTRYQYHDHLTERFAHAFADTVGTWCEEHHLALTGHLMGESTLTAQTQAVGEAMRSYRSFQLPGIDMLCDDREYTTAKQAQSAAHQYGRPGVLSELYGVTNWDFAFVGHKAQGDWQAALGVTVRVHHLAWVSMAGEAKRDYPASIGYQSPWYREYPLIEDHFARLNTALTRGKALVRVGVIHPIESFWLCFGPLEQTAGEREEREQSFSDLTNWLLFGLIDFDFIAESLLPELAPAQQGPQFHVGEARYDTIIVPAMRTIRSSTLARLETFRAAGGTLLFAGEIPSLVDACPSERAWQLAARSLTLPFTRRRILEEVEPCREISVRLADGRASDALLHQIRVDGERRFVFLCNTDRERERAGTRIRFKGNWRVTVLETLTGEHFPLVSVKEQEHTVLQWSFPAHGSLLLLLEPGWQPGGLSQPLKAWREATQIAGPVPVTLAEPNVLLLDQARYRLDDEPWQSVEEVLRVDNLLRQHLGYPLKKEVYAQPWARRDQSPPTHRVSLAFEIHAGIAVSQPRLALENAAQTTVWLDEQRVPVDVNGWFVDEAIQTITLPDLAEGVHQLVLEIPYDQYTSLEWCYLLGDFGVEMRGRHARLTAPVRALDFGDWTCQGLPFYGGNVTYHCQLAGQKEELAVRTPKFKAPLLSVSFAGEVKGKIAFAPFQCELGRVEPGSHALDITVFGNRVNTFGCLHHADERVLWIGPNTWRSEGDRWAYEYQLKPMGLLVAPRILECVGTSH